MHVFEWKFIHKPYEDRQFFKDDAGKPLEIVLQPKKFKGIFFNIKDIEKYINLFLDKYGDFHHIYSGSSP